MRYEWLDHRFRFHPRLQLTRTVGRPRVVTPTPGWIIRNGSFGVLLLLRRGSLELHHYLPAAEPSASPCLGATRAELRG
jgi:hypothetical protein